MSCGETEEQAPRRPVVATSPAPHRPANKAGPKLNAKLLFQDRAGAQPALTPLSPAVMASDSPNGTMQEAGKRAWENLARLLPCCQAAGVHVTPWSNATRGMLSCTATFAHITNPYNNTMGLMDSVKSFWHSVTTEDHYALYGLPYANSTAGGSVDSLAARLREINNSLAASLVGLRNGLSTNIGGYRPGLRSLSTNVTEMQTFANGQPPLPSMDSMWNRIEAFLEAEYPELEDSLNSGASSADLNEFEKDLAAGPLPVEVRQFYKRHDGQFRGGKPTGLLMGLTLLDIELIMEEYALWAKVAERVERQQLSLQHQQQLLGVSDESLSALQAVRERISNSYLMHQKSVPADAVQPYYVHRGWVPIARDLVGNMVGLDLAPGPAGVHGQIILYGRDYDTKVVVATSLQELLFQFVTDLETGSYQIDKTESYDDNGFLDSTREDDYMIGDEDEDNGELAFLDRDGKEFGKDTKGKLSYMEVLKRRALRRFGVQKVDSFQTAFTPQRVPRRKARSGTATPVPGTGSKVGSTADLLKETLIDDVSRTPTVKVDEATERKTESAAPAAEPKTEPKSEESAATEPENQEAETAPSAVETEIAL